MQVFKEIQSTDYMSRSREVINNNFKSVAGQFSGDAFPTANLVPYMKCWRTDQKALYQLDEDLLTWREVYRIIEGKVYSLYSMNSDKADLAENALNDKNGKGLETYVANVAIDGYKVNIDFGNGEQKEYDIPKYEQSVMVGALPNKEGAEGLVPKPLAGSHKSVLLGDAQWHKLIDLVYPIGSYYWSSNATNPSELFGGTWTQVKDRFVLAAGDKYKAGATGGSETVTLTLDQMPAHTHTRGTMNITGYFGCDDRATNVYGGAFTPQRTYAANTTAEGGDSAWYQFNFDASKTWTGETSSVGGGKAHNNMPPYEVAYCWKRTA